jgi:hypothetical protein
MDLAAREAAITAAYDGFVPADNWRRSRMLCDPDDF